MMWIVIIVLVAIAGYFIVIYNGLVKLKQIVNDAWSGIDVQLKRRYDLIPNLVETVKGYAGHEAATFEKVTAARTMAMNASGPAAKGEAENMLTGALKSLFAVSESYPDLKANQNFLDLQGQLSKVEDEIQFARRFYNGSVREFNTKIEQVPSNLVAGVTGFKKREFFELGSEAEKEAPKVSFDQTSKPPLDSGSSDAGVKPQ